MTQTSSPDEARSNARLDMPDDLRADVRTLGVLLGRVLREDGGEELFTDVERLRELAIGAVEDTDGDGRLAEAQALIDSFTVERADQVARAFTCYFHLVNLAEEYHRVRALRAREDATPRADALAGAYVQLAAETSEEEAARRLREIEFHPVLTAHPTEARRRAVSGSIRRISELVAEADDPRLGANGRLRIERRLLAEIDTMWRTAHLRETKPSPVDEVFTAMSVFEATLFEVLPQVYRQADDWLLGEERGLAAPRATPFVRLGSWIGADRDGNPNVTAKVTRQAAAIAAEHVLTALERETARVGLAMTLDEKSTPPSAELTALWGTQRQLSEEVTAQVAARSPREPHRRVMLVAAARLAATRERDADLAYSGAEELLADLRVVQDSLRQAGALRKAHGDLQNLIWQVESFGFHLTELEVRQHSKVHAQTLAWIADPDSMPEPSVDPEEVLETFRSIAAIQRRHGVDACRRYTVSFTRSSEDLIAVYRLAEHALGSAEAAPVLDVVPLFETFDDLQNAPRILEEMLEVPQVQARLEKTGRRMEVMLGYSDSAKDVGPVSATLAIYTAQEEIAAWAQRHDIRLTLFHGKGGALGRGGGPANRAILAQPPHSVDGRFKLTEQGEVITARYGDRAIAARHIDQVAAATLLASAPSTEKRNAAAAERFAGLASTLDERSRERFFDLIHAEGFAPWFAQVTPQEEVGLLPLGSRPARRGLSVESLEDLRAIPWVFAWTQARINLTGWFGLGSALAAVGDIEQLRTAYREWPLFNTLIDNVEMSLAKTDRRIARQYLALGDREDLAGLVLEELDLTTEWVLRITGHEYPLEGRRVLGRAVQLRNPYVDALSLIQLRALRALRTETGEARTEEELAEIKRLLLLSVNGIAAGLQNTG
ncbi:phosphoenolpyruvate carboxylase [Georgenia satyanarayanai]|uniref:phosphoenolpyruvate carboxylase n=1 Tax=Georgenia satyanarayanai TaxID=860221 RepID=UPI00203F3BB3|nr:phosphoenolpyruvate carboxylase [Georgenia satyanarayanai]MCM3660935.1 phosphoenolpyruvate carboxylase [Georgenia satyanarayanai]